MKPQSRPCACGGEIEADYLDPAPGVRAHNESEPHRSWSARRSLLPVFGPGGPVRLYCRTENCPVMVPAGRDYCHGCRRRLAGPEPVAEVLPALLERLGWPSR